MSPCKNKRSYDEEVWLPGRGLTPKIVFCTIRHYGTALY